MCMKWLYLHVHNGSCQFHDELCVCNGYIYIYTMVNASYMTSYVYAMVISTYTQWLMPVT